MSPTERALAYTTFFALILASGAAQAQTWVSPRTAPWLGEIVAVDATGETDWPYGAEDVAGDGLANFAQQERSIDIRTAYAAADPTRLWLRTYVSDQNAAGGNVVVYAFIDADESPLTGGSAAATEVDPLFTTDPSNGGYEYAVEIRGNATVGALWEWNAGQAQFVAANLQPNEADAEAGQDADPIELFGDDHGYVQTAVALARVGLTPSCTALLFFRSVSQAGADLEVGQVGPCVPADANGDDVPDVVVPVAGCTNDTQCPGGGICVNGQCLVPEPCLTAADCAASELCSPSGHCVPAPSGNCTTSAECGDLVCAGGQCDSCLSAPAQCAAGTRCAPTGHCVLDGGGAGGAGGGGGADPLAGLGDVRGGSLACRAGPPSAGVPAWLGALLGLAVGLFRRRAARAAGGRS